MEVSPDRHANVCRLSVVVRGVVQGVGFRPFVYNAAVARALAGWVQNEADTVRLEVEGQRASVESFLEALRHEHPPQARIESLVVRELPAGGDGTAAAPGFEIRSSAGGAAPQPTIPADLAICDACLAEIRDPRERRFGYPFTNCTNCGPRWSIIENLPYDRPRTSMARFTMCAECQAEYDDPTDRRFHAQPIACPQCGPQLRWLDGSGRELASRGDALAAAADCLWHGGIVALQGLGGFQLLVDASDETAVARLRARKHRPDRPLALMLPTIEAVRECCLLSADEERALASHMAPILLLRRRSLECGHLSPLSRDRLPFATAESGDKSPHSKIAASVAPGNIYLGIMLPYTPLHHLLITAVARPLVCTSGNLSEEPMAISVEDALARLGSIADGLLVHDRPIVRPVDDSVARLGPDGIQVLRRARGFAPLPFTLAARAPVILAVGGHLKNTVALALGQPGRERTPVVASAHIGDLDDALSLGVFRRAIDDLVTFFRVTPQVVACDLHPDYASTNYAEQLAARWQAPLVRVQHHHAHVAACMAEHGLTGPVLGLSWDGTGYGPDGTVWGGESLRCEGAQFTRVAHLRTFALPGGDQAMREPRRSALGLLYEIMGPAAAEHVRDWFTPAELRTLLTVLASGRHAPRTSSMGRLFDAVAALTGLPQRVSFEGQAAMALEFAADKNLHEAYPLPVGQDFQPDIVGQVANLPEQRQIENLPYVADWEPLVRSVLADVAAGEPASRISARFHNALAVLAVAIAGRAGVRDVVLTGGCFQNALLAARVRAKLREAGYTVYLHHDIPPGDGGIALGQVYVAAMQR
jgi:hydrogenase maturation protein HypF